MSCKEYQFEGLRPWGRVPVFLFKISFFLSKSCDVAHLSMLVGDVIRKSIMAAVVTAPNHWPSSILCLVSGSSEPLIVGVVPARIFMRNLVRSLISWPSRAFAMRHALVLWTTSRVLAMQIAFACISSYTLKMAHLRLQVFLQGPLLKSCSRTAL